VGNSVGGGVNPLPAVGSDGRVGMHTGDVHVGRPSEHATGRDRPAARLDTFFKKVREERLVPQVPRKAPQIHSDPHSRGSD